MKKYRISQRNGIAMTRVRPLSPSLRSRSRIQPDAGRGRMSLALVCRCHDAAPQLSNATGLLACQVTETRSSQSITASEARTWFGIVTLICLPLSSCTR